MGGFYHFGYSGYTTLAQVQTWDLFDQVMVEMLCVRQNPMMGKVRPLVLRLKFLKYKVRSLSVLGC